MHLIDSMLRAPSPKLPQWRARPFRSLSAVAGRSGRWPIFDNSKEALGGRR